MASSPSVRPSWADVWTAMILASRSNCFVLDQIDMSEARMRSAVNTTVSLPRVLGETKATVAPRVPPTLAMVGGNRGGSPNRDSGESESRPLGCARRRREGFHATSIRCRLWRRSIRRVRRVVRLGKLGECNHRCIVLLGGNRHHPPARGTFALFARMLLADAEVVAAFAMYLNGHIAAFRELLTFNGRGRTDAKSDKQKLQRPLNHRIVCNSGTMSSPSHASGRRSMTQTRLESLMWWRVSGGRLPSRYLLRGHYPTK